MLIGWPDAWRMATNFETGIHEIFPVEDEAE